MKLEIDECFLAGGYNYGCNKKGSSIVVICNSNCKCMIRHFTSSQYHFTALKVTILEMKEPSLSLEHWEGCPTFGSYSKLTYTQLQ